MKSNILRFISRRVLYAIPLILGVTLISFTLMVYFGPDKTYDLLGKNATTEEIAQVRRNLGYDQSFVTRYLSYLESLVTLDLGNSDSTGESVVSILKRSVPISAVLETPGFILGNILSLILALTSVYYRGKWQDKAIMLFSVLGLSISFLIVIIVFQIVLCSSYGLDLFPVSGWDASSIASYLSYATVPTLATGFVTMGYNTRFYRAVLAEESTKDHIRTARAYGISNKRIFAKHILKNSLIPISTRVVFSIPYIIIGGSLIVESYFSIPGVGLETYNAITTGDQPLVKAIVAITACLYVFMVIVNDVLYFIIDPRIELK